MRVNKVHSDINSIEVTDMGYKSSPLMQTYSLRLGFTFDISEKLRSQVWRNMELRREGLNFIAVIQVVFAILHVQKASRCHCNQNN